MFWLCTITELVGGGGGPALSNSCMSPQYAVVKIVREKYLKTTAFETQEQLQAFLSELYVYLVDQMHVALNQVGRNLSEFGHGFTVDPGLDTASGEGRETLVFKAKAGSCFHLLQLSYVGREPQFGAGSGTSVSHCYKVPLVGYVQDVTSKSCCSWLVVREAGSVPSATHLGRALTFLQEPGSPVSDTTKV